MITRPLLSAKLSSPLDYRELRFPMIASPKVDGIRLLNLPTGLVSRKFKTIPNRFMQQWFKHPLLIHLDGEIVVTSPTAHNVFNLTQSAVMTERCLPPEFVFLVFDCFEQPNLPYTERLKQAEQKITKYLNTNQRVLKTYQYKYMVQVHEHKTIRSVDDMIKYEDKCQSLGFEGIMLRSPTARYKSGRSTLKENTLVKFKRTEDDEAIIVGFEALEHNTNPSMPDAFGHMKRSSHKSGKVADNLLGTLLVRHPTFGELRIGGGFDEKTRRDIWANRPRYKGRTVTFSYQREGMKDKPRFPVFKGFRED